MLFAPTFKPDWPLQDARLVRQHQLEAMARWLAESPDLFIDYETTAFDKNGAGAVPFMLGAFAPDRGAKVVDFRFLGDAGRQAVIDGLSRRTGRTAAFNISFEQKMSRQMGFKLGGEPFDPMLAAFAVNELRKPHGEFGPFSQKALAFHELGKEPVLAAAVHSWLQTNFGSTHEGWECVPASLIVPYNCEDLELGWELYKKLESQVIRNGQGELVRVDSLCTDVIGRLESRGIAYDVTRAKGLMDDYSARTKAAQVALYGALGRPFDIGARNGVYGLLYGDLKLPMHPDQEKQGKVDHDVLAWMQTLPVVRENARAKVILESLETLTELDKLTGTYLMPWSYEWQRQGIIHPHISMMGARTRRFSANDPNMQNVPARTDLGAALRSCFVSRPGFTTYSMDESQAEYRAFAHYSNAPKLVHGYRTDPSFDIHELIAKLLGVKRKEGKHLNFGVLYGMGRHKLARKLLRSLEEADILLAKYYGMLPELKQHKRDLDNQVRLHGYVRDEFGGRRHLLPQESYKALNTECQMTVGNLMRRAMVLADPILTAAGGHALLQVHDELIFELPGTDTQEHLPVLRELKFGAMQNMRGFRVPYVSDCEVWSPDWQHSETVKLAA